MKEYSNNPYPLPPASLQPPHRRSTPDLASAAIDTTALNDVRLSYRAKGLYAYLMSRPHDWQCSLARLEASSKDGRHAIRHALQELQDAGYLVRTGGDA